MAEQTENERIARQCCKGGSGGGNVDEAIDVVDRSIGRYKCPVGGDGRIPARAQSPSTVSPFGNLRG